MASFDIGLPCDSAISNRSIFVVVIKVNNIAVKVANDMNRIDVDLFELFSM